MKSCEMFPWASVFSTMHDVRRMYSKSDDRIGVHDKYCCNIVSGYL